MYVGIDAHKKYCKSIVMDKKGAKKQTAVFDTTLDGMRGFSQSLDAKAKIVVEASTSGLYVYDYFHGQGFDVVMAHPQQVKAIANAKIKTDDISAEILAHLLRTDLIPEAYVPPLEIRELRDIVRHRVALVRVQTSIKNRIHAILTREGIRHGFSDLFGRAGRSFLESVELKGQNRMVVDNFLVVLDTLESRIAEVSRCIDREARAKKSKEVEALTTKIKGLGLYSSLLITAEIGDIRRFSHYKKLCSWVGLIPSTHSSGGVTYHGKITKRGNKLMRWSLIQATWRIIRFDNTLRQNYTRLEKRIGKQKAIVATARKLVKRIYFILQEVHENQAYGLSGKIAPY
jgi:transposase